MFRISNESLTVIISAKGAELQSIYNKDTDLEYMWSGDPAFWGKKSPVLFPIVGGLKNNAYQYQGRSYSLSRHGFARDKDFEVSEQTETSIIFSIHSNEDSLENYPFHFKFSVTYQLKGNELFVKYIVENTGIETMFFSVGAHPAFKVPLVDGTNFSDNYLLFSQKENTGRWPLSSDGLIENNPVNLLSNTDLLPLQKELFYKDALVFKELVSNSISILSHSTKHGLKLTFNEFPYMGIWSAKNADFVCIEPWCGIADSVDATGELENKEGINSLAPLKIFERSWSVAVF